MRLGVGCLLQIEPFIVSGLHFMHCSAPLVKLVDGLREACLAVLLCFIFYRSIQRG